MLLVTNFNSFGLAKDSQVIESLRPGCIRVQHHESYPGPVDTAIHLEVIGVEILANAKKNVWVPNLEWANDEMWRIGCSTIIDEVWCKSQHCYEVCHAAMGDKAIYTGWIAEDIYDPKRPKYSSFLHLASRATYKGAAELIEAWRKYKIPRTLTVVGSNIRHKSGGKVRIIPHLSEEDRKLYLNHNQYYVGFGYEGYGFALHEAALCGAQIMTVDAPSTKSLGQYLIPAAANRHFGQIELPKVDPRDIALMVEHMIRRPMPSLRNKILKENAAARKILCALL